MIRRSLAVLLLGLLVGCGHADGPVYDLAKYDDLGTLYNMHLYMDRDIVGQKRSWSYDSAREHYVRFWQGGATVYMGPTQTMNFGAPTGTRTLISTGDMVVRNPFDPGYKVVCVLVTNGDVIGDTPMGPCHHIRVLAKGKDRYGNLWTTIVIKADEKMTLEGLYTMLNFFYADHLIPKDDPVDFHTEWVKIFVYDESIVDGLRASR